MIYAEVGERERFDQDIEVVSYAGLNPVICESADSWFEGGNLEARLTAVTMKPRPVCADSRPHVQRRVSESVL